MALIACPECGKEVSDKAAACPYCGNPLKENPETEMSTKADAVSAAQKKNYFKWSLLLWPLYVVEMIVFVFVQLALGLDGKIEEIVYLGILGLITAVNFVLAIPLIRGMVKDNYLKTQSNKISIKGVISLVLCALFLVTSGKSMITSVIGNSDDDSTSMWESQVELSGDEERAVVACSDLQSRLKNPSSLQLNKVVVVEDTEVEHAYYVFIDYSAQNGFGGTTRSVVVYKNGTYYTNDSDESYRYTMAQDTLNFCVAMGCPYTDVDVERISSHLS